MKKRLLSMVLAVAAVLCLAAPAIAQSGDFFGYFGVQPLPAPTPLGIGRAGVQPDAYFGNQLSSGEQIFYNAIEALYVNGALKTGTGSVDVTAQVGQDAIKAYTEGNPTLAADFIAGRDAFMQDHCDLFYVDASKLTLRVGTTSDGRYAAELGKGTNANYYSAPFDSEGTVIAALDQALVAKNSIVEGIKTSLGLKSEDYPAHAAQIVKAAHDALIDHFTYSYPTAAYPYVQGVYALASGQYANCEGYARSLKWILDDFGISSVLITGTAVNAKGDTEDHMWNYVRANGAWYGVDATWDDPIGQTPVLRDTYLLRGGVIVKAGEQANLPGHFANPKLSPMGRAFRYPGISAEDCKISGIGEIVETEKAGLKVGYVGRIDNAGDPYTELSIAYNGKNFTEAAVEGHYLAMRIRLPEGAARGASVLTTAGTEEPVPPVPEPGQWGKWFTLDPQYFTISETPGVLHFFLYRQCDVQVCVTTIPSSETHDYYGDYQQDLSLPGNHTAILDPYTITSYSDYMPPPFVLTSEPGLGMCIDPMTTHSYTVVFDDTLIASHAGAPAPAITINTTEAHLNDCAVTDLTLTPSTYTPVDGITRNSTTVTFKFKPSEQFQGYVNVYNLQLENVIGEKSKKPPKTINVCTNYPMNLPCPAYVANGSVADAFVIAHPTLVVNEAMDIFEYEGTTATPAHALDIRLVASIPTEEKKNALTGALEDSNLVNAGSIMASATYDLTLKCAGVTARLKSDADYNVTIGLPYPPGFHYEDHKNVEFKAYHYKMVDGKYVPEELICQITPQGLVVIANNFSPFTVAALPKGSVPEKPANAPKVVNVANKTAGGVVLLGGIGASGLYTIENGGTGNFEVTPDSGYIIDKLLVNGKEVTEASGKSSHTVSLSFDAMEQESSIAAYFIAQSVKAEDATKPDFTPVVDPPLAPLAKEPDPVPTPTPDYDWGGGFDFIPANAEATLSASIPTSLGNLSVSLTGQGLQGERLVTNALTAGADYAAITSLANKADIVAMLDVSLKSGLSGAKSGMAMEFQVGAKHAGERFTLVHKLADGTFEYFYATVDANGGLRFGPIHTLSPFMLVNKVLLSEPDLTIAPPKTGVGGTAAGYLLLLTAVLGAAALAAMRRKRA